MIMNKNVLKKIEEIKARFSGSGKLNVKTTSTTTSLSEAIKTKKQADLFMQRLRALSS